MKLITIYKLIKKIIFYFKVIKLIKIFFFVCLIIMLCIFLFYYFKNKKEGMNERRTAIIIEPREHKALPFVLKNFCKNLDDNWDIIIVHGTNNEIFVKNIITNDIKNNNHNIEFVNLGVENLTIEEYNILLTTPSFYDNIKTETFLIFQTDSMICEDYKDNINEFLEYDYVGAPNKEWVGNGGLSLRKKSKMLDIIKNFKRKDGQYEDQYFTEKEHNLKIPDITTANKFSNEGIYSDESFGVHKPWWYLNEEEINKKEKKCKGLKQLIELNK
jgi:hypothetical protein|tara:strand:+ start:262 stop:1077 length:816 start_codon:yes stop_codon:yes gene_type:complete